MRLFKIVLTVDGHFEREFIEKATSPWLAKARARVKYMEMIKDMVEIDMMENVEVAGKVCYQCGKQVNWLASDSRCGSCTRLTPKEVRGEI